MPERETIQRAEEDKQKGKSPSTQAGEFVREEIHHIRQGKHGAQSTKQAIAIGLSKARRAGVGLSAPKRGKASSRVRKQAERDLKRGKSPRRQKASAKRSQAASKALRSEGASAASKSNLSRQARTAAGKRGKAGREQAARKAVRTRSQHRRAA